jgi:O-Antigen ligase
MGLFFLVGVFVTMPILTIDIGGRLVSIFTILLACFSLCIVWSGIDSKSNFELGMESKALTVWFILSLISSIIGAFYFYDKPDWQTPIFSYIPKIGLYLVLLLCALRLKNEEYLVSCFLRGFISGCIANLVWAIFEGISYYYYGIILNNTLFTEYVKTLPENRQYMTIIMDGIIRTSGFNTDPAHLGGLIPIIVLYSLYRKKIFLLVLALVALIFSGSTTALVTSLFAMAVSPWNFRIHLPSFRRLGSSLVIFIILLATVLLNEQVRVGLHNNLKGFYDRTFENYVQNHDSGPRYIYHAYLAEAMQYSGLLVLTGTGFGTASYPYVDNPEIANVLDQPNLPYDPESTYISYLFDVGIFGLTLYLFALISLIRKFRRKIHLNTEKLIIYSSLCGIFFSGFFYHYTLTAYQVLILIFAASSVNWNVHHQTME